MQNFSLLTVKNMCRMPVGGCILVPRRTPHIYYIEDEVRHCSAGIKLPIKCKLHCQLHFMYTYTYRCKFIQCSQFFLRRTFLIAVGNFLNACHILCMYIYSTMPQHSEEMQMSFAIIILNGTYFFMKKVAGFDFNLHTYIIYGKYVYFTSMLFGQFTV